MHVLINSFTIETYKERIFNQQCIHMWTGGIFKRTCEGNGYGILHREYRAQAITSRHYYVCMHNSVCPVHSYVLRAGVHWTSILYVHRQCIGLKTDVTAVGLGHIPSLILWSSHCLILSLVLKAMPSRILQIRRHCRKRKLREWTSQWGS